LNQEGKPQREQGREKTDNGEGGEHQRKTNNPTKKKKKNAKKQTVSKTHTQKTTQKKHQTKNICPSEVKRGLMDQNTTKQIPFGKQGKN